VTRGASLRIELLGGFRALADGRPVAQPVSARQQELIAYLVLHARGAPIQRQRVSGSLWPESSDEQALTNLRRELHHLQRSPRLYALVDVGSRTLAWRDAAAATVDVPGFEAAVDRGLEGDRVALQEAARVYKGDLLPDCAGDWIETDRERLRQRARQVLTRLVGLFEADRAFGEATEHAQHLLRLDPLDEAAWCALMRCHARRGERATALHLYQQCTALLRKELGVEPSAQTRLTYREILDLDAEAPVIPAPPRTAVYTLLGRQPEWLALVNAWRMSESGQTRLCLIRGEAGIGKTRLAEELVDWSRLNGISSATTRCYAGEGRLAYAPIAGWLRSAALRPAMAKLDSPWMTDVARLHPAVLSERPEVAAPTPQLESWQHLRFFEALAQALRVAAPLILVVDDLQWADADTLDWLQYFVRSGAEAHCLVVGTARAEEEQDNPPLGRLLTHLERENLVTTISLGPLDRNAAAQLAGEVAGRQLDEETLARTFRESEGHPLFIVERGRMEMASQADSAGTTMLPEVQAIVGARLGLLSDTARAAAEVAAAVGRDFRFDILAQASDLEEDTLVRALDELWRRHIVRVQTDERWDFTHDRIREVAYSGIGPARRRLIHRRIAQGMELLFADRLDDVSASIAMHLERGGQLARAVPFLDRAAGVAMRVSATEEAIRCLTHALSIVGALPAERDRDARELALRSTLSIALNSGRGYGAPEIQENLDRVFTLSLSEGRSEVPVRWLWVAFTVRFMLGDLKATRDVSERALAISATDPSCRCEAHHAMAATLLSVGDLDASKHHFEAALAAYDEANPQRSALGSDLGVFANGWFSHTLWLLGDENAALTHAEQAIVLARRRDHVYSEALALAYAALLHQMRLDRESVRGCANAVVTLCDRYGFAYYGDWARILLGWELAQERPAEGVVMIESALERLDRQRAQARRPYYLSLLADAYGCLGDRARAASAANRAIDMALERGDTWWLPALYLQQGELGPPPVSEPALKRALALAREQGSRGLERRILASPSARAIGDAMRRC
jgi:DNA-binding SARP family transcriptional activator